MKIIEGYFGIFDKRGEFYGVESALSAGLTADQMTQAAGNKRVYQARPVTIIDGDALAELRKLGIHEVKA